MSSRPPRVIVATVTIVSPPDGLRFHGPTLAVEGTARALRECGADSPDAWRPDSRGFVFEDVSHRIEAVEVCVRCAGTPGAAVIAVPTGDASAPWSSWAAHVEVPIFSNDIAVSVRAALEGADTETATVRVIRTAGDHTAAL
jgi:hypothetical protein